MGHGKQEQEKADCRALQFLHGAMRLGPRSTWMHVMFSPKHLKTICYSDKKWHINK